MYMLLSFNSLSFGGFFIFWVFPPFFFPSSPMRYEVSSRSICHCIFPSFG